MSLFKKNYLKKLRADLVKETGGDISDEAWNKVIEEVEAPIKKDLEKSLPRAFWFSLFKIAEEGDVIFEIDDIDIGAEIRQLRSRKSYSKKDKFPRLPKRLRDKLKLKWELKKKWLKKYGN